MTMMIWWQNTGPAATCSIQGIRRSSRRKSPSNAGSLIFREHKFAEMSTWQQELYVQVRVQVLQNCTRVQVQVPSMHLRL